MNDRERFIGTFLFEKTDKVPLSPGGPRESTLKRWHAEGLPEGRPWMDVLLETIGVEPEKTLPRVDAGVSLRMKPEFEEKVLKHENGHYLVQDWMGAIVEISDEFDVTYLRSARDFVTRKWHKFPVENRSDWEEMKKRFDPKTPGRYPEDFEKRCEELKKRDYAYGIGFSGPFWQLRDWCGFENLCMMTVEDPDFVMGMAVFWKEFVLAMLEPILQRVPPDMILFNEDMAYKEKAMISPAMTRRFLMPVWQAWSSRFRKAGCPIIEVDSDGYIGELIPLWIESGINACIPIEVAAGNDLPGYRKKFGKNIAYRGGIDKRAIAKGGKVMEAEVMRNVTPLFVLGGYIPMCDHGVPPDISWPDFIAYSRLLAKLTGWL